MSRLNDLLDDFSGQVWTDDELVDWVDTLPENVRIGVLSAIADARNKGMNANRMLSRFRTGWEAQAEANRPTWFDTLSAFTDGWFIGGLKRGHMPGSNANPNIHVARIFGN